MKRALSVFVVGVIVVLSMAATGSAAEKPIQLSLIAPIQLVPESDTITPLRISFIYGKNAAVRGLDFGLVNHTTSGLSKGLQLGFVGFGEGDFLGLQWSTINVTKSNFKGMQWGFINYAGSSRGLQMGFFNYSENMYGLQIGLINVIRNGKFLPVFPIVNFSF